jgi:hypothetical protein
MFALIGGFVTGKAFAQEQESGQWVAKPVQCGTVDEVTEITKMKGLTLTFSGDGVSNSVNFDEPLAVYVFLGINPETNEWAITEIDPEGDTGCVIGYGDSFRIDAETMKKLSKPTT